jgi:U6 snRNA-associated Sm-like protein LSm6
MLTCTYSKPQAHINPPTGDLQSVDGYMNIALERCKEVSDGRVTRNWGDAFVRGNNGT